MSFCVPPCVVNDAQQLLQDNFPLEALALILVKSAECSTGAAAAKVDGSQIVVTAVKKLDKDFYLTLRVNHDCSQSEIKKRCVKSACPPVRLT